jgi:hypothetical protein
MRPSTDDKSYSFDDAIAMFELEQWVIDSVE